MDKKALHKISYGLYVVCSKNNGKIDIGTHTIFIGEIINEYIK